MVNEERVSCQMCGAGFYRGMDQQWKRLCLSCWKLRKEITPGGPPASVNAQYVQKIESLERQVRDIRQLADRYYQVNLGLQEEICFIQKEKDSLLSESMLRPGKTHPYQMLAQFGVKNLLKLVHPDKHFSNGGDTYELAKKVTQALLKMMEAK